MNKIVLENDTVIENNLDRAIELEVIEKNIFFYSKYITNYDS